VQLVIFEIPYHDTTLNVVDIHATAL
jgi:hypothetical protein